MTNVKGKISLLICLALSLFMVLVLSSCDNTETPSNNGTNTDTSIGTDTGTDSSTDTSTDTGNTTPDAPHEHTYGEWTTTEEPSCTEAGEKQKSCSCGDIITEEIEAAGHTEETLARVEPACTETGLTEGKKCSVCGEILVEQEEIEANGHQLVYGYCSACEYEIWSKDLEYKLSEDESYYIVTGIGTCTDTDLYIAGTYNDKPVKEIARQAFFNQKRIRTVTIGNGIEVIGPDAFFGCERLTEAVIGNDVKDLNGFRYCEGLARMTIGSGVMTVSGSFSESYKLVELYNLSSINVKNTSVGQYALNIYTPTSGEKKTFETDDGYIFYVDGEARYLVAYKGLETELVLPESCNGENYEIYRYAFNDQDEIKRVIIPDSVTKLPRRAIAYCDLLVEIVIGDGVTIIDYDSITYNEKLTFLTIGKNVTNIDSSNLYNNERLIEIYNKSSLEISTSNALNIYTPTEGAKKTFITDDGYIFYEDGDVRYLIGYTGELVDLVLPEGCNGSSYEIYMYAFYDRGAANGYQEPDRVKSVLIPDSVTAIGDHAFTNNISLRSIKIGKSVEKIGTNAFSGCTGLAYVCNLSQLQLKLGSDDNGMVAYYALCLSTSGSDEHGIKETDDGFVFLSDEVNCFLIDYVGTKTEVVLPSNYYGKGYEIGKNAFSEKKITSITIPNSVTSIGSSAFRNCTSLTDIIVNENNSAYKSIDGVLYSKDGATLVCYPVGKSDTSFTIPSGVTSIESYAFYNCTSLTSVTIPNSVTSIGNSVFYGCSSLTSVTIPDSVTTIGSYAFYNCTSLTEINFNATTLNDLSSYNYVFYNAGQNGEGIKVTIGKNVTKIPAYLFYPSRDSSCSPKITSVVFEEGSLCESIGNGAFYYCTSLTSVTIPDSVTSIGSSAFYNCTSLTSITIPNSVTSIGEYAFSSCKSLTSITIPNSVTSIGSSAFRNCTSLTICCEATSKPSGWSSGWNYSNCPVVWGIQDNGVTEDGLIWVLDSSNEIIIAGYTGDSTTVEIPTTINGYNVTSIGSSAFRNCTSLTDIIVNENNSAYKSIDGVLYSKDGATLVCYPVGKSDTSFTIPSGVTSIESYAFYNCTSLTSITIPNSVTSIGSSAFRNCTSLESITIPDSVTTIGSYAFYNCTSLTSITIPNSVTSIGEDAFSGCGDLIIYCEATSKPSGWSSSWNSSNRPVVWGYCEHINTEILPAVEATCIETGLTEGQKCSKCGEVLIEQEIIPVNDNHTSIQIIQGYAATCTQTGLTDGTKCFACGITLTSQGVISAKGHTEQKISAVEPTCTETGLAEGTKCSKCGAILVAQNTIDALGHIYENSYECSRCDYAFATPSEGLKYSLSQDGTYCIVTGLGTCDDTKVVIPYTHNGLSVKGIDEWAFYGEASLESIIIPSSIESIADFAFYGCSSLTIYCVAESMPSGWSSSWNNSNRPVYWYSDSKPTTSGSYWHYGANGEIVVW